MNGQLAPHRTVAQCKSCPWRVGCVPEADIPNGYSVRLHENLRGTCQSGDESLRGYLGGALRVMACHYSEGGQEFACAGWLNNQIGEGNNISVRLAVMTGRLPVPKVDGEQHACFEDTLPKKKKRRRSR